MFSMLMMGSGSEFHSDMVRGKNDIPRQSSLTLSRLKAFKLW